MAVAIGTSSLVIALNSASPGAARSGADTFDWMMVVPVTLAAINGSLIRQAGRASWVRPPCTKSFARLLAVVAGVRRGGRMILTIGLTPLVTRPR